MKRYSKLSMRIPLIKRGVYGLIGIWLLGSVAFAEGMNGPDDFAAGGRNSNRQLTHGAYSNIVFGKFIRLFQLLISPLDGARSPSYPTGSAYGARVVQTYGVILGSILTADRLLHETDYFHGGYIQRYGILRYNDPPEFNTYWWDYPDKTETDN